MIVKKLPEDKTVVNAIRAYRKVIDANGINTNEEGEMLATIHANGEIDVVKDRPLFCEEKVQLTVISKQFNFYYSLINPN